MARSTVNNKAASTTTGKDAPAQHYMNMYVNGKQVGYMVLDATPEIAAKANGDAEFLNRLIKHASCTATYREAGVSSKEPLDLSDI